MDERELSAQLELVNGGDADALQRLIVHYHAGLRATVAAGIDAALRRRIDPDDVLQQAYVSAFTSLSRSRFERPGGFYRWLERIALHELKNQQIAVRRRKRDVRREIARPADARTSYPDLVHRLAATESTPSRRIARDEAIAAVMSCLARLPDQQREVVRLRFLEDVPVAEIAERLGKTDTAVYTLCHRGLKTLRALMVSLTRYLSRL